MQAKKLKVSMFPYTEIAPFPGSTLRLKSRVTRNNKYKSSESKIRRTIINRRKFGDIYLIVVCSTSPGLVLPGLPARSIMKQTCQPQSLLPYPGMSPYTHSITTFHLPVRPYLACSLICLISFLIQSTQLVGFLPNNHSQTLLDPTSPRRL